jgi:hypothetical protein
MRKTLLLCTFLALFTACTSTAPVGEEEMGATNTDEVLEADTALEDEKAAEELLKLEDEESNLAIEIQENLDLDECEKLTFDYLRTQCINNISLALAASNQDPAACDNITDIDIQNICLNSTKDDGNNLNIEDFNF